MGIMSAVKYGHESFIDFFLVLWGGCTYETLQKKKWKLEFVKIDVFFLVCPTLTLPSLSLSDFDSAFLLDRWLT